ncbi:hypothetical protein EYC84_006316 [Monilinia fructicola]|uniref:Uncharacterized protein n=1 Tax=Monilinia fructicola TaxID=38448 RepID=A0A5M9K3L6_MONFR|nr:hypothetical protein EYC84_006316 [Monilinia fructicola]
MDIQEIRRLAGVKDTRDLNETRLKLNQARQEANIENGEGEHLQSWIASLSKEPKFLKDAKVEYEVAVFSTTARQKDSNKPFQSFGTLKIGNVGVGIEGPALKVKEVPFNATPTADDLQVFYEPQKSTINSADKPVEVDISASTRCTSIHPRRYQKHNDSQYTWSFDITSTNYETEDAEFTGTLTTADDVIYEWTGSRIATEDRFDQQQQIELEKPENLDGEFTELKMLSPFTSSIQTSQDGTQETVSKDMARIEGNKIMQKLMANALDDKTKKNLVPDLLPLRKEEEKILHENRDFLRLAGIHDLAEGIKAVPEFDKEIRARIQPKFVKFLEMLMHDEEGADQTHDPAADYGWDRKTRAKEIKKLRGQYLNVVSSTYTEGYKALRPQWNRFLKQPKYWFTVLSEHIMKDDTMERFRVAATSTTTDASYESKIQVQVWTQNLMMLKTCAAEKGVELDMEPVYAQLKSNSVLALTEAQIWNDDMKE